MASPVSVVALRRRDLADRLDVIGGLVGETALIAVIAVIAAQLVPRLRSVLPAGVMLALGGTVAAVGLALMAWTIELTLFVVGGSLFAVGIAPAMVTHRVVLATDGAVADRLRTMSWYWAALAVGVAWPLGVGIFTELAPDTTLWIGSGLVAAASAAMLRFARVHDEDLAVDHAVTRLDTPWPRRSIAAAFGVGTLMFGAADAAQDLLLGEWQRSSTQNSAVLAAGLAAAALISWFGPWYHRLHRLDSERRADAIGIQLVVAGFLAFLGALSFTYIGLVVCWMIAGAALGLAAAGLDTAAIPPVAPERRRTVAAHQVAAASIGALAGGSWNAHVVGGWSDQWKVALLGLPLVAIGWAVRRGAEPAVDPAVTVTEATATTVPHRVLDVGQGPMPLLSVEKVSVSYGSVQVLFDVDLTVEEGQVVALLGTNGAGKTTLLRAISGLEPTTSGRIVFAGLDITRTRPTWRVGMGLHQIVGGDTVAGPLSVADNLRLFGHGLPVDQIKAGLAEVYDLFPRLAERRGQRAETLSGGEKQMLALSRAIIARPRLLLIDEFSLGLAPTVIADLVPVVRRIADGGASVLMVEQSVNIALSVADHAFVMEKGEIGHSGSSEDLRARPELLRAAYLEGLARALETS